MSSIKELRRKLKKDETWMTFQNIMGMLPIATFKKYGKELEALHKSRQTATLSFNSSMRKLIDSAGQDQSLRSRVVGIEIEILKTNARFATAYEISWSHVANKYRSYLTPYKTKGEKEQFLSRLFKEAEEATVQMDNLEKICKLMKDDIDKAIWIVKYSVDAKAAQMQKDKF